MQFKKISVIGFGKIGQAVAANILRNNLPVVVIDTNTKLINSLLEFNFESNEPDVKEIITNALKSKKLMASSDFKEIQNSSLMIICIPLLIDIEKNINETPFLNCIKEIAPFLTNKTIISVETTIPVGFSRNKILPLLEKAHKKHGVDFYLIYSPERVKSGTMLKQLLQNPKIIGGINNEAAKNGIEAYSYFFPQDLLIQTSSIETSEMIKLAGMVYRDINIALSNQLAQFAKIAGIDTKEVIELANTDGEANLLYPGIGVGGHCTPVYPYFLINSFDKVGLDFSLAKESRRINDIMASYTVDLVDAEINDKKALILGLGFRPDVKEDTLSSTYLLDKKLKEKNYKVFLHDPLFSQEELKTRKFNPVEDIYLAKTPLVFLVTNHSCYKNINWYKLKESGCKVFIDGRNSFDKKTVESAGIKYFGIGR
ncbi:MAG: nucleotide sugar dehydrogenase [Candidatus Melainabacteria bacterium]|nr:nucleotide sugar dehydrogenase [Candidatus Melainabacteria bacterium]